MYKLQPFKNKKTYAVSKAQDFGQSIKIQSCQFTYYLIHLRICTNTHKSSVKLHPCHHSFIFLLMLRIIHILGELACQQQPLQQNLDIG